MTEKFSCYDTADYLNTSEDMALYLEACLEENDPALIAHARGMTQLAKDTGISREGLYKALSADGNPEFDTLLKVTRALGIKLHAEMG